MFKLNYKDMYYRVKLENDVKISTAGHKRIAIFCPMEIQCTQLPSPGPGITMPP